MTVNRYTKLIKTLKESPTNSMGGVYSLNPQGFDLRKVDPPKTFYADVDGNWPSGIPGNDGDKKYVRPAGFWDGGTEWEQLEDSDLTQDFLLDDPTGKSTDGLIAEDGSVKTPLPPNSRHFILGPLVDGYVQNHGYDNYTNIGYLQKDTRQFVLLARIQGQFTADLHQTGARVWDGSSNQLTIINSNFTLEMAEWFRDQITDARITNNVPYFYSGGVPQAPLNVLQCPNCPPNMFGGVSPGIGGLFGSGTPPTLGTQYTNPPGDSGNQEKAKIFNLTPDQARTLATLLAIGLSVAAVIAILFPEPSTTAAGAGYLAGKFRFGASLKRALSQLWRKKPRTYNKIEYPKPKPTPKPKPKYDPKKPGGGKEWQQAARDWQRQNPGKYNPYRTDSANQLMKKYEVGKDIMNSYDHIIDVEQKLILETFHKALLNETAPTGSGPGGGTELADVYVDQVSQEYDADQLQQASDDANDLAGDKALTDQQQSDIDKQAEDLAKQLNDVDYDNPESMSQAQIENFFDMVYSIDPEWLDQSVAENEGLIDRAAAEKAYDDYQSQKEYLSSEEYYRTFSGYAVNKDIADSLWPYVQQLEFRWNVPYKTEYSSGTANIAYLNGVQVDTWEDGWGALIKWGEANQAHYDVFYNKILPAQKIELEKNTDTWMSATNNAYREFFNAVIKEWGQKNADLEDTLSADAYDNYNWLWDNYGIDAAEWYLKNLDKPMQQNPYIPEGGYVPLDLAQDPFSLEGLTPTSVSNMSDEEKKKLLQQLMAAGLVNSDGTLKAEALSDDITSDMQRALEKIMNDPKNRPVDMPMQRQPYGGNMPTPGADELPDETQTTLAANQGPSTPVKYDSDMKQLVPNQGGGRPGKVRLKPGQLPKAKKNKNKTVVAHYEPPKFFNNRERKPLTESKNPNQRRILREIRQPVEIKKAPSKYKINFSNNNTFSSQTDELVGKANARGQAWKSENKRWSGYETTEKDNIIQDRVGHGKQAFDYMIEHGTKKNKWRSREVQEELNKIAHEKAMLKENPDFKSPFGNVEVSTTEKNDDNFNKVSKKIKQIASKDKEVKPEYPEDDQQLKNNMLSKFEKLKREFEHEKLNTGERASAYYKRLDPTTAKSMPDAAYPQIDAFRDQAKKKPK